MSLAPSLKIENSMRQARHIAIIMDGNGRWAEGRGLPRLAGHKKGVEAAHLAVEAAADLGVDYLTLFAFSSENWSRPAEEVRDLMGLLRLYLQKEISRLNRENIRLKVIGERAKLADDIKNLIIKAEEDTQNNDRMTLIIALSYGARDEIITACQKLARDIKAGLIEPHQIDEAAFERKLWTADIPDPDLIIRTSGEERLSNFLLWQAAYAEFIFLEEYWPDFSREILEKALRLYSERDRRFGGR